MIDFLPQNVLLGFLANHLSQSYVKLASKTKYESLMKLTFVWFGAHVCFGKVIDQIRVSLSLLVIYTNTDFNEKFSLCA